MWGMSEVADELKGRTRIWMLSRMAFKVFAALSPMCRQRPMMSSTKESKWPYRWRSNDTSHDRAGAKGMLFGSRMGDGMLDGFSHEIAVVLWYHHGLLAISNAKSVMVSMTIHHSARLNNDPNVSLR